MENNYSSNIDLIKIIASVLGKELLEKIIFVGGSVVGLYSSKNIKNEVRFTEDIDFVIKSNSIKEFNNFENILRKKGFENDLRKNAPICRWIYKDITVDAMTTDSKILGFSSIWYSLGIEKSIQFKISDNDNIKLLSPEYFIASKIEAHNNRGEKIYVLVQIFLISFIF